MKREPFEVQVEMLLSKRIVLPGSYSQPTGPEADPVCPAIPGKEFVTWYEDVTGCWCVYWTDGPPAMFCYIPCA